MKNKRIQTILNFSKKYVSLFLAEEVCLLGIYAVSVVLPLTFERLVNDVLYSSGFNLLPEIIITYIILFVTAAVFNIGYGFISQTLQNKYVVEIKNALHKQIIYSKASVLSDINSGDLMSRIDHDSEECLNAVQRNLFHIFNSILLCASIVIIVGSMNAIISIILVFAALIPIIITKILGQVTAKYSKEERAVSGVLSGKVYEAIKGFREIKLLNGETTIGNKLFISFKKIIKLGNKKRWADFAVNKIVHGINLFTSIVIYAYSLHLMQNDMLKLGGFVAIITYVALLHKKFNWMLRIHLEWHNRKVSIDRINEILNYETESDKGICLEKIESIEFKNVCFGYGDNKFLKDICFKIEAGEKVALTGESGSGKSTITSLLTGLYKPDSGNIYINGININDINVFSLRRQFSMVSQDGTLFDDTLRNNLTLFNKRSEEDIYEALKKVGMFETITSLESGLDTRISNTAIDFSGGQKQRLMIARALLGNTSTFILDEATASLDVETEEEILKTILSEYKNSTFLMISHRESSLLYCNRTLILKNGCLSEFSNTNESSKSLNFNPYVFERMVSCEKQRL